MATIEEKEIAKELTIKMIDAGMVCHCSISSEENGDKNIGFVKKVFSEILAEVSKAK